MDDAEAAEKAGDDGRDCGAVSADLGVKRISAARVERGAGCAERTEQLEAEGAWRLPARLEDGGRALLRRVRQRGCPPYIRNDVWPLLLGIHALSSTEEERAQQRRAHGACYHKLRMCARILANLHRHPPSDRAAVTAVVSHVWTTISAARPALNAAQPASHASTHAPSHASHAHSPASQSHPHMPGVTSPGNQRSSTSSDPSGGDENGNCASSSAASCGDSSNGGHNLTGSPSTPPPAPAATTRATTTTRITSPLPSPSPMLAPSPAAAPLVLHDPVALLSDFGAWQRAIRLDAMRLSAQWDPFWGTGDGDEGGGSGGEVGVAWPRDGRGDGRARGAAGGLNSAAGNDAGTFERSRSSGGSGSGIIRMSSDSSSGSSSSGGSDISRSSEKSSSAEWCSVVEGEALEAALDEVQLGEEEGLVSHTAAQQMHVARVVALLEAYTLVDPEVGYCQGMCDVAAPFVATMADNADAFAAFFAFMHGRWWSTEGSCSTNHAGTSDRHQHQLPPASSTPSPSISSPFSVSRFSLRPSSSRSTQSLQSPCSPASTSLFPASASSPGYAHPVQRWSPRAQGGVRRLGGAIVPVPHCHQRSHQQQQQQQLYPHQRIHQHQQQQQLQQQLYPHRRMHQQQHSDVHWSPGGGMATTGYTADRRDRSAVGGGVSGSGACSTGNSSRISRSIYDSNSKADSSRRGVSLQGEALHHSPRPSVMPSPLTPAPRATSLHRSTNTPVRPLPPTLSSSPSRPSPPDLHGMRLNFLLDESGIHRQLAALGRILRLADPELHGQVRDMGGGDCLFAYRMVVVGMRRDLPLPQTLMLWEVCWADALAAAMPQGGHEEEGEELAGKHQEERKQLVGPAGVSDEKLWINELPRCNDHKENISAAGCMDGGSGYGSGQQRVGTALVIHGGKACATSDSCGDGNGPRCSAPVVSQCLSDEVQVQEEQQNGDSDDGGEEELGPPTGSLLLFVMVVLICSQREALLECEGLDEVLLLCHGLTKQNNLNLSQVIAEARRLAVRLKGCW